MPPPEPFPQWSADVPESVRDYVDGVHLEALDALVAAFHDDDPALRRIAARAADPALLTYVLACQAAHVLRRTPHPERHLAVIAARIEGDTPVSTHPNLEPQTDGSEPTVSDRRRAAEFWQAYLSAQLGLTDGVEALNQTLDEVNGVDRMTPFLIAVADVAVDAAPEFLSGIALGRLRDVIRDARAAEQRRLDIDESFRQLAAEDGAA